MKRWLKYFSCSPKEFYTQVTELFDTTINGFPFDIEAWEMKDIVAVDFKGSWIKRSLVGTDNIGDIVFNVEEDWVIVNDYTLDRKLSRLLKKTIGTSGKLVVVGETETSSERFYKVLKSALIDYLSIETNPRARQWNGISFKEWSELHFSAVKGGFFDIADIAFRYMLYKKIGWEKTKEISAEHWATYLKSFPEGIDEDE